MIYTFTNLSVADVVLLGKALGKLTIEEAGELHARMQKAILEQEAAARQRQTDLEKTKTEGE